MTASALSSTMRSHLPALGPRGEGWVVLQGVLFIAIAASGLLLPAWDGPARVVTTVAGVCRKFGYAGDGGPATDARLSEPSGVAVDRRGNLYIADTGNHRIRKVARNGIITTVAGNGDALPQ